MKKNIRSFVVLFILFTGSNLIVFPQGVGINVNGNPPDPSAILDAAASDKGMLMPRLTTAQRNAIVAPAEGLIVFNTTTKCFDFYAAGVWQSIFCSCTPPVSTSAGAHSSNQTQITWNWTAVSGATGYKYNTVNNYETATDNGLNTSLTQTGLTCETEYTLFVWANRDECYSPVATLTKFTDPCVCTNTWYAASGFPGTGRSESAGFSIGTKVYVGTGHDGNYLKDFWEWDQGTGAWTQKADFVGVGRSGARGFAIGDKGYIGTGSDGGNYLNDFWEWNQATNTWSQKANFVGAARDQAVAFSIGSKGYIATGGNAGGLRKDMWEWDQSTNTWSQKADFGGTSRRLAVAFAIGTKGYIGTGLSGSGATQDFWEWNQSTNTWTQKANVGGGPRFVAAGFAIGSKGYIGTGYSNGDVNDFWEWDQAGNTWTSKATYPGTATQTCVGISAGTKGYIATGSYTQQFWEFCP